MDFDQNMRKVIDQSIGSWGKSLGQNTTLGELDQNEALGRLGKSFKQNAALKI